MRVGWHMGGSEWLDCIEALLVQGGCDRPPGTPLRECPPLRSSFISLRGAPDAMRTWARCWCIADQRRSDNAHARWCALRSEIKGGAEGRRTFAKQLPRVGGACRPEQSYTQDDTHRHWHKTSEDISNASHSKLQPALAARHLRQRGGRLHLGSLIGLERQIRQRAAGLRTNTLVAVGAAVFVDMANRLRRPRRRPCMWRPTWCRASAFWARARS
jgi:hypothetical protein